MIVNRTKDDEDIWLGAIHFHMIEPARTSLPVTSFVYIGGTRNVDRIEVNHSVQELRTLLDRDRKELLDSFNSGRESAGPRARRRATEGT